MRDLSLDELSDEIRDKLHEQGVTISAATCRILTKGFFKYVEKLMQSGGENKFVMYHRDITQIFEQYDCKKLCEEFAADPTGMITYPNLVRKRTLSRQAAYFLKHRHHMRMYDK